MSTWLKPEALQPALFILIPSALTRGLRAIDMGREFAKRQSVASALGKCFDMISSCLETASYRLVLKSLSIATLTLP